MPISFSCATCGKPYVVDERFAGKKAACRMCGNVNLIPSAEYAAGSPLPLPHPQQPGARPGVIPDDFDALPLSAAEPEPERQETFEILGDLPARSPESSEPVIPVAHNDDADDELLELVDDDPPPVRAKVVAPVPVEPLYPAPMPAKPVPGGRVPIVPVPESPQPPPPARPMTATPVRALKVEECPNCGSALEANAIFCTECGYNLKTGQAATTAVLAGGHHADDDDDDDDLSGAPPREPNPALRMAAMLLLVGGIACSVIGILAVPFPALGGLTMAGPILGAMLCVIGAVIHFIEQQTAFAIAGGIATLFSLILMFAIGRKPAPPPPPVAVAPPPATAPTTQPELPKVERTGPDTFTVRKPKPGVDVIAYWRPVLQDADPGIRLVAIEQLRRIPAPWTGAAADEIATRANADEDPGVRRAAMTQIALASTQKTVAAAIKGLDDPDPEVASLALKALAKFKDESAITPLASHFATMGDKVIDVLAGYPAQLKPRVAEAYRSILTAAPDASARGHLLGLIVGKLNPADAGPLLVQYLNDPDAETRAMAMGYLGEIRYAPAVGQVVDRLSQDPGPAAKALLAYGPVAEKALDDKLLGTGGGDAKTRLQVLWVLKQTATIGSLQVVQAAAKDPDLNVAVGAREVWRKIDPQGLSPVDEVLMDLDGAKPFQVRALEALKTLPTNDHRAEIARRLFAMIGGTSGGGGTGGAAADAEVQTLACNLLETWADDAVKDLVIASLRPEGEAAKQQCLIKLAVHWKDVRAVKPLCDMLAQSKGTPEIMAALTEFGSAPEDQLIKMLTGSDAALQEKACDLLKEVGTRRCFRALTAIANNKTGDEKMKKLAHQTVIDINRRINTAEAAAAKAAAGGGAGATTNPTTRPTLTRPTTKPAGASLW